MTNTQETNKELVDRLFFDLNDRKGFSLSNVDDDIIEEWKNKWISEIDGLLSQKDTEWRERVKGAIPEYREEKGFNTKDLDEFAQLYENKGFNKAVNQLKQRLDI